MTSLKSGVRTPRSINFRQDGCNKFEVFCRLCPMQNSHEKSCISIVSDTTIQLTPPQDSAARHFNNKEVQYMFKKVFSPETSQKQVFNEVAQPLVKNLLQGKNGLLFTYGVTGSGKTYTINGTNANGGILTRCIDVIFNSIGELQPSKKHTFRSDKQNGFEVQSDTEVVHPDTIVPEPQGFPGSLKRNKTEPDIYTRVRDMSKILDLDNDNVYSLFVSYVEIYNNNVYDLLEEIVDSKQGLGDKIQLNNRIIRANGQGNMYVHGANEVEVRSPEEAFQVLQRGLARRKVARTQCNKESSRSHSIFTLRLVQAPLDMKGEKVLEDKRAILVSQLSLVDLAGSERSSRTQASEQRNQEANNINRSLLTLRSCLEILRENQMNNCNKYSPYRDTKLTHLFKTYFTGEGDVRMIVCVNPRAEDYDENLAVMKFAEMSQDIIQTPKPIPSRVDFGLTPGRRQLINVSEKLEKNVVYSDEDLVLSQPCIDSGVMYNFGPPFPRFDSRPIDDTSRFKDLLLFLETRRNKELELIEDVTAKAHHLRKRILTVEEITKAASTERDVLKCKLELVQKQAIASDTNAISLKMKLESVNRSKEALDKELERKTLLVEKLKSDKERIAEKLENTKIRLSQKYNSKLKEQDENYMNALRQNDEKLKKRIVQKILSTQPSSGSSLCSSFSTESSPAVVRTAFSVCTSGGRNSKCSGSATKETRPYNESDFCVRSTARSRRANFMETINKVSLKGPAVSNPRQRRSRSAGPNRGWVHHQPVQVLEQGTLFQPTGWKKRKAISKLTNVKNITDPKTAKYSLLTHEQNTDGEVETHLFKADVLPTVGGGAQVVFTDVETLKQSSPTSSPTKKINHEMSARSCEDLVSACKEGKET